MEEWSTEQWEAAKQSGEKTAFYLYTPMCGTCAVASKMMSIIEQLLPQLQIGKANINFWNTLPMSIRLKVFHVYSSVMAEK